MKRFIFAAAAIAAHTALGQRTRVARALTLALGASIVLGVAPLAHAADVTIKPAAGSNFVVKDAAGTALQDHLRVQADGGLLSTDAAVNAAWAAYFANYPPTTPLPTGTIPASGAGARLMWYPAKAAFRAGYVLGTTWDDANIGLHTTAMGYSTIASGISSTAMGAFNTARGDYSIAIGHGTDARGNTSTAMGLSTIASGDYSTAMGFATNARGNTSTAMGTGTTASGDSSTAIGRNTNTGICDTSSPPNCTGGLGAIAMGVNATAKDNYSFILNTDKNRVGASTGTEGDIVFALPASPAKFSVLAGTGGVACTLSSASGAWSCSSDRNLKTAIEATDGRHVLEKIVAMPVGRWEFKGVPGIKHIGPMAQDFKKAFDLGDADDKHISLMDAQGVLFAAVQGLYSLLVENAEKTAKAQSDIAAKQSALGARQDGLASAQAAFATALAHKDREISALQRELAATKAQADEAKTQIAQLQGVAKDVATLKAQMRQVQAATPILTTAAVH